MTDLVLEIFRTNGRLLAAGDALTRPYGQSAARWQVLGAIRAGPQTVPGVARMMGLARQSVQRTTDLLAEKGLVEYVENPAHRRSKLVQLSDRGQTFLRELAPHQALWSNTLASSIGFTEADVRRAYEVVRSIRVQLERSQRNATTSAGPRSRSHGATDHAAGNGRRRES